ncbi:MAG: hypothetical protein H6656_16505 [Ardenticatenaceae bacterium]|nr:hypothetical protein [Ardenticatenaceae bacterium]
MELLPGWLRIISYAPPFTYALRACAGADARRDNCRSGW